MTTSHYQALTRAPKANAPLVFAFHGTGGDEHQFSELVSQILPKPASFRRAAMSRNMARCGSSAAQAKASTTWLILPCAPKKWRRSSLP